MSIGSTSPVFGSRSDNSTLRQAGIWRAQAPCWAVLGSGGPLRTAAASAARTRDTVRGAHAERSALRAEAWPTARRGRCPWVFDPVDRGRSGAGRDGRDGVSSRRRDQKTSLLGERLHSVPQLYLTVSHPLFSGHCRDRHNRRYDSSVDLEIAAVQN